MNKFNSIFLIVGPSGSGKSTICDRLINSHAGLSQIQSYTTRPPRYIGEKGHIFVTDEEFDGHRYAATSAQVEENDIYVIDPAGVEYFRENYHGRKHVYVVGIWATEAARKKRMFLRGDPEDAIVRRLESDRAVFSTDVCDVVFYNKNLQDTFNDVIRYILTKLFVDS